jgi:hypothetical protein
MRSSDDAAGGGKATVCAAAGRHQHAAHVPVNSVRKRSSFERTAYATPCGFFAAGLKHTAAVDHGADGGYRAWRGRVKAEGHAGWSGATARVPPLPELPGQRCHPSQISYFTGMPSAPAADCSLAAGCCLMNT